MATEDELTSIDTALAELEFKIMDDGALESFPNSRDEATFKRLRIEAKTILDHALGFANNFSMNLHFSPIGGSSLAAVQECRGLIQGAVNHLRRGTAITTQPSSLSKAIFVDLSRLAALRAAKSPQLDLTRLIRLCEELNIAYSNDCFMAVAMLLRAITDHVSPVLGCKTFPEVANNYPGEKSFRGSMQHLDKSLRNIADAHLHVQIRSSEVLPTGPQVDFRADLDVLLGEVVRVLK